MDATMENDMEVVIIEGHMTNISAILVVRHSRREKITNSK